MLTIVLYSSTWLKANCHRLRRLVAIYDFWATPAGCARHSKLLRECSIPLHMSPLQPARASRHQATPFGSSCSAEYQAPAQMQACSAKTVTLCAHRCKREDPSTPRPKQFGTGTCRRRTNKTLNEAMQCVQNSGQRRTASPAQLTGSTDRVVCARYVAKMTDTPSQREPGASDSGKLVSRPGKRALEKGDAAPPGGKPKLLTSKILGTAHPHKPRIGPQYQAVVPPFQTPPTRPPAGVQQGHENGRGP